MSKYRGVSYIGIFLIILMAAIILQAIIAIWPAYYDNWVMDKQIKEILETSTDMNPDKFKSDMSRRMDMNGIRALKADDIFILTVDKGNLVVRKKYSVQKNYLKNLFLTMEFDTTFEKGKEPINNVIEEDQREKVSLH